MLSTLALGVVGLTVLAQRANRASGERVEAEREPIQRDVTVFAVAYTLAIGAAFVPVDIGWVRPAVAVVLVVIYALYVRAPPAGGARRGRPSEPRCGCTASTAPITVWNRTCRGPASSPCRWPSGWRASSAAPSSSCRPCRTAPTSWASRRSSWPS